MKKFRSCYIEITNSCNLNCSFCPKTKRERKFMTVDEYQRVIDEIKPFCNYVYLHLMGEPLLHPNLKDILKVSENKKIKTNITTNGTLIKNQKETLLNSTAIKKVSFSAHSFEANENGTDYEQYLEGIADFSLAFSQTGREVVIKFWNSDSTNEHVRDDKGKNSLNEKMLSDIFDYFKNHEASLLYKDKEKYMNDFETKGNIEIVRHVYIQSGEKFEWPLQTKEGLTKELKCLGSVSQFGVLVSGDVVPCCLDSEGIIKFGNIYKENFKDIIGSERFKTFQDSIKRGLPPCALCKKCSFARKKEL